jgi:hypothetical protein
MERKNGRKKMMVLSFLVLSLGAFGSDGGLGIATTFDKVVDVAKEIGRYGFILSLVSMILVGITGRGPEGSLKIGLYSVIGSFVIFKAEIITDWLGLTSGVMF